MKTKAVEGRERREDDEKESGREGETSGSSGGKRPLLIDGSQEETTRLRLTSYGGVFALQVGASTKRPREVIRRGPRKAACLMQCRARIAGHD